MKLRIGDKVRFLNEVGEGVISRIKDKDTVYVEMQDGFEIPYHVKQLVPIHTELILDKDTNNIELDPEAQLTDTVYFVIEPDHELQALVNDFKLYLFNASSYNLIFTYSVKDGEHFQTIRHGEVGAYQKVLLKQVKMPYFREYVYHKIEALLYKNTFYKPQAPFSETIYVTEYLIGKTRAVRHEEFKFSVYAFVLKENFFNEEQVKQELSLVDIEKLKSIKEFRSKEQISKSNKDYLRSLEKEVDLHIEELISDTAGLSNYEMLNIQLERVEKELDEAIAKKMRKLILIHGVGNGRLRQEIHSLLRKTGGLTFHDAPYKDYGYGATQVNIL